MWRMSTSTNGNSDKTASLTYAESGVDTAEGARAVDAIRASVRATYRPEVIGDIGGFGGLFSAAALKGMDNPVLVSGADGVGTKIEIARAMDIYDTLGIDLVAMCVNDVLVTGAEPLFFLDYIATEKIDSKRMVQLVAGVAEGCKQAGCALIGGEMAEHPGTMIPGSFDMSGFCVAVADRPNMVDGSTIAAGDVIFGLPSSGLHSNGFSLVRRVLEDRSLSLDGDFLEYADLELFEEECEALEAERHKADSLEASGQTLGQMLLIPTRIYVKLILDLLQSGIPIKGMAHITGGGITENLDRILPETLDAVIDIDTWLIPPIIRYICGQARLGIRESFRTFNCGIGFTLVVSKADAPALRKALDQRAEEYYEIGHITEGTGTVRYSGIDE